MEAIDVGSGVSVPAAAMTWRGVRSGGPGGQNVNKVASKVELHVDLAQVTGLDDGQRQRLEKLTSHRRDATGRLLLTSQLTRDQSRNLEDVRAKVRALVAAALVVPKRRRATRPSAGAREARLTDKRRRAGIKKGRGTRGEAE